MHSLRRACLIPVCLLLPCALLSCTSGTAPAGPFDVDMESGARQSAAGDRIRYNLFIPKPSSKLPPPPWPAVVLNHGFARNRHYQRNNALYLARRGIVVLTPDQVSLLTGESAQLRNIANTVDHIQWLRQRAADPEDTLAGLIDPKRIGLAGHSAGGAISFEAAVDLQATQDPAAALVLLDTVPWSRTVSRAADLAPLPLASLRSEPSPCNADAAVLGLLKGLTFAVDDVRIVGATHCDPENPTDWLCSITCGSFSEQNQAVYQRLMYLFFQDALKAPAVEDNPQTYQAALAEYKADGVVETCLVTPLD